MAIEVNTSVLPAAEFNQIPTFEQQVHTLSPSDLCAIGELFLRYGAHEHFCAGLLHRHLQLCDGEAMVHVDDLCSAYTISDLDLAELKPHSFFLGGGGEGGFQPYEFALSRSLRQPTADFLSDLQSLLQLRHLSNIVALTPLPDLDPDDDALVLETQLAGAAGSHSSQQPLAAAKEHAGTVVITNWAFDSGAGNHIKIREVKACVKNNAGVHEVKR